MHRLINRLAPNDDLDLLVVDASFPVANRAATLRTRALAEERSIINAATILTSDPADIRLLVDLTGATNIAVHVV